MEILKNCILCESKNIKIFDDKRNLFKCGNCGLVFDNPRPEQEEIVKFYGRDNKYHITLDNIKELEKYWNTFVNRLKKYKKNGTLLDVGAGIGQMLSHLKDDFEIYGTEVSDEAVKVAKRLYGIDLTKGYLEDIDFSGKKFDVITMCQILEHFPYPGKSLKYCASLLKDDGIMYITIPNESFYSFRMVIPAFLSLLRIGKYKDFSLLGHRKIEFDKVEEIHLSHFSEKTLDKFFIENGFEILEKTIEYIDPFIDKKGIVGLARGLAYDFSVAVKNILNLNLYNSMGYIVRKKRK